MRKTATDEMLEKTAHVLDTFAFHVAAILDAKDTEETKRFSLHFWGNVSAEIEASEGLSDGQFSALFAVNGKNAGNAYGAIREYANLCAVALQPSPSNLCK